MEIHYSDDKDKTLDPSKLNGFAETQEASRLAGPIAFFEAYRLAKAYNTPLVGWDEEKQCVTYIDANKYSFEDIKAERYKGDPSIYEKPACLSPSSVN